VVALLLDVLGQIVDQLRRHGIAGRHRQRALAGRLHERHARPDDRVAGEEVLRIHLDEPRVVDEPLPGPHQLPEHETQRAAQARGVSER
jgi:hypothetical protein